MLLSRFVQLIIFYSNLNFLNGQSQFYYVQPHDVSALIGSNVTIPCVVSLPHGDVQWTKDGLALGYERELSAFPSWSIIGDENRGEFNFFIESLKLDDEGIFACEVSPYNDAPALKQIAHIRVLVPPKDVGITDQSSSIETKVVMMRFDEIIHQIHCRVEGARPAAHMKWFDETGQEFPATSRTYFQDRLLSTVSTLTLMPSKALDRKVFTCSIFHETLINQYLNKSFEIRIISPPDPPIIYGYSLNNYYINGSTIDLSCQSYGGYPLGKISWYRLDHASNTFTLIDNKLAINQEENMLENNISISIASSDNKAVLSCHVTNDYLNSLKQVLQTNITLQVAFGPTSVEIEDIGEEVTTLTEGTPRKFVCRTSVSNPRANLVWKLDGQSLSPDIRQLERLGEDFGTIVQATKTIGLDKPLKDYHKKNLSCEATNPETGHVVSDSTILNIIYDATNIEMHGISTDKIIQSGDRITVQCILIGGNPLGTILWYKGNDLLDANQVTETNEKYIASRVEFVVSSSDNNLPLTCKGQVESFPQRFASFLLNVTYSPTEIIILENEIFSKFSIDNNDYENREFECRTSSSNPQFELVILRQTKDGVKHSDVEYTTTSSYIDGINSIKFKLPKVDISFHENLLICEATLKTETLALKKQVTYNFNINHKPYFETFNTTFEIKEHQSFHFKAIAHGYPLGINYTWFHPSGRQIVNDQLNTFVNDGEISIKDVQRNDLGYYRCLATNDIGSTEITFKLDVLYEPLITRAQGYTFSDALMLGSSAILSCVIDANPISLDHVRWYKDNQEVSFDQWEKRTQSNEVSIVRQAVRREDAGQYACEIDNTHGKNRATIPLVVQYPPEIDRTDQSRTKAATDSERFLKAQLHCSISSIPKPTVTWMKNNEILSSSEKYEMIFNERTAASSFSFQVLFDATLSIFNVTKSDYGVYQCKAENPLGVDMIEIILTGITIPDPPSQIQIVNKTYSSLLINWTAGFDGGAPQTYQIRYRLSTDDRYVFEYIPPDSQSFEIKNLQSGKEYHLSIRSNNSHHLSEWTDNIIVSTEVYSPSTFFYFTRMSTEKFSFNILFLIIICGVAIILINLILITWFVVRRQRKKVNSENSSTTGTNDTEANAVDIFQPIPSNFFLPTMNSYKKYDDDDDIKRPFVPHCTSMNHVSNHNNLPVQNANKEEFYSPYDNIQLYRYYSTNIDYNRITTYRNLNNSVHDASDIHECIRAELV